MNMNSDRYVQYHNVHLVVCNDDDDCVYALMFVGVIYLTKFRMILIFYLDNVFQFLLLFLRLRTCLL